MILCNVRCVCGPRDRFEATVIEGRDPGPHDVTIDIAFAGICHSDVDHVHNNWGKSIYPLVPGHGIASIVAGVGSGVRRLAVGDRVGVGNMVDSCKECKNCKVGQEQNCAKWRTVRDTRDDRFCAANNLKAKVEIIDADKIDLMAGDVRYRFVIDTKTIGKG